MSSIEESIEIGGQKLVFQIGKLARSATSAIFAKLGDTCVLTTVVVGKERADLGYFPLSVNYVEKFYAGGKIKGSRWVKREGKPTDKAVLTSRLIDRAIRPLFPEGYKKEVQIIITLLSVDGVNSPEILAAISTSAALHLSSIPWKGPVGFSRIGYVKTNGDTNFIVNPSEREQDYSEMDLIVASSREKAVMIEAAAKEIGEEKIIAGVELAIKENHQIIEFIEKLRTKVGLKKESFVSPVMDPALEKILETKFSRELKEGYEMIRDDRGRHSDTITTKIIEAIQASEGDKYDGETIGKAIDNYYWRLTRKNALEKKERLDGRKLTAIRPLGVEVSVLPRTHGSAIFQRGNTQVMSIATLAGPSLSQLIEGPEGEEIKHYIHHYYMPPYSVGEAGRIGYPSRREIGHGALAEKALEQVLPSEEEFPYTIRVVSEVLSSNGSTSMASTCGSTLALMDAGVPIKGMVAGISIGLIEADDGRYVLLTDICGPEDHYGDMDFKVAGTEKGVTAIQLDVKNEGLKMAIVKDTFVRAREARMEILEAMRKVISHSRTSLSRFAPKVVVIHAPEDKIGQIIGPGGKNIRRIIAETETDINVDDEGHVSISGINEANVEKAVKIIEGLIKDVKPDEVYEGVVKRVLPFGAFVEILPGKEGMVHVSKMGKGFVKDAGDVLKVGQKVKTKVIEVDRQGRINLLLLH